MRERDPGYDAAPLQVTLDRVAGSKTGQPNQKLAGHVSQYFRLDAHRDCTNPMLVRYCER